MITKLVLDNWMSYSHVEIPFNEALNVITGQNHVGKSAILHAFNWFLTGEPKGSAFIKNGCKSCQVAIHTEDHVLTKLRSSQTTKFGILSSDGILLEEFHKSKVPNEVLDTLGIDPLLEIGNWTSNMNFSFQLDSPFLISEPASVGASVLGYLSGSEDIDAADKDVAKDINKITSEISSNKAIVDSGLIKLEQFDDLDIKLDILNKCKNIMHKHDIACDRQEELSGIRSNYNTAKLVIDNVESNLILLYKVGALSELRNNISSVSLNKLKIKRQLQVSHDVKTQNITAVTSRLLKLETPVNEDSTASVYKQNKKLISYTELCNKYSKIKDLINGLKAVEIPAFEFSLSDINNKRIVLNNIIKLRSVYAKNSEGLKASESVAFSLKDTDSLYSSISSLSVKSSMLTSLSSLLKNSKTIETKISLNCKETTDLIGNIEKIKSEINAEWDSVGGKCPVCGSEVNLHNLNK